MSGEPRVVFRWDYFFAAMKSFAFFGLATCAVNFRGVSKAYGEMGLLGFVEIALWLVGASLLGIGANYLWCLGLQHRAQKRGLRRRQLHDESTEG